MPLVLLDLTDNTQIAQTPFGFATTPMWFPVWWPHILENSTWKYMPLAAEPTFGGLRVSDWYLVQVKKNSVLGLYNYEFKHKSSGEEITIHMSDFDPNRFSILGSTIAGVALPFISYFNGYLQPGADTIIYTNSQLNHSQSSCKPYIINITTNWTVKSGGLFVPSPIQPGNPIYNLKATITAPSITTLSPGTGWVTSITTYSNSPNTQQTNSSMGGDLQKDENRLSMRDFKAMKKGTEVILWNKEGQNRKYDKGLANPYFPEVKETNGEPIVGKFESVEGDNSVRIEWPGSGFNTYYVFNEDDDSDDLEYEIHEFEQMLFTHEYYLESTGKKPVIPAHIKAEHIDRLILKDEPKKRIIAVLKQYGKKDLIFNTWGLGETIEYGRGMSMLFWGPPGTGKTFAANQIAKAMGKELMLFDSASLQSSVPGQMERNLKAAFKDATKKKAVVFFDECDSMMMSRDNMGQIMSAESNCLLSELEKFEGICILATNRIAELDKALERRISLIVNFPIPDGTERRRIWQGIIPKKLPLAEDVDIDALADEFEMSGGFIKNVVLNAARMAAADECDKVCLDHFIEAIKALDDGRKGFDQKSKAPTTRGKMKTTADITRTVEATTAAA
jgi:AAA+ superfamily predicted ATPase